jgi:hypothetical protein
MDKSKLKKKKRELEEKLQNKKIEEQSHRGASQYGSRLYGQIQIIEEWIEWIESIE